MSNALSIIQIVISIALVGAILLQQRGSGLSSVFGAESSFYHTRRGAEKIIFWATVVLAFIFMLINLAPFFLQ